MPSSNGSPRMLALVSMRMKFIAAPSALAAGLFFGGEKRPGEGEDEQREGEAAQDQ